MFNQTEQAQPEYGYALNAQGDWCADGLPAFLADREVVAGTIIARGVVDRPMASSFVPDADDVINHMANSASDEHSEFCDGFPDVGAAAQEELEQLLLGLQHWADKHFDIGFYQVSSIENYTVTVDDVGAAEEYRKSQSAAL